MKHTPSVTLLAILGTFLPSLADVTLPAIFSDHMVLQRDAPQHVWGTAEAGERITVTFDRYSATTTADTGGNWLATLPTLSADGGKPHKLTVKGNNEIVLKNIPNFSAVLYHFGKELCKEVDVPMGLINRSWGGSPIEPWTITKESSGKMYNGMIAPIVKFPVRGTIWYQGETNVIQKNGLSYGDKMKDLILGWRDAFHNKEMPFYSFQTDNWTGGTGE